MNNLLECPICYDTENLFNKYYCNYNICNDCFVK